MLSWRRLRVGGCSGFAFAFIRIDASGEAQKQERAGVRGPRKIAQLFCGVKETRYTSIQEIETPEKELREFLG